MKVPPAAGVLLLLAALAAGACAGARSEESLRTVTIRVKNNVGGATSLGVFLVPEGGTERSLGLVEAARTGVFRVEGVAPLREYRLVARTGRGQEAASREFIFRERRRVTWDVYANLLDFASSGEKGTGGAKGPAGG